MSITRRDFLKSSFILSGSLLLSQNPLFALQKNEQGVYPTYVKLESEGKLAQRVQQAYEIFEQCELCPRKCGANRLE